MQDPVRPGLVTLSAVDVARAEQQRRLYETILSTVTDLIYVFGVDYRFIYANDSLLKMWGRTAEEAVGRTLLELGYEPWHAEMHEREIDQVVATRAPVRGEVPFTGTAGRRIYEYIFVPVLNAQGDVEAIAGTTRDVTERKQAEEELKHANHAKDEFLALLSHELRTPLNAILGWTRILRSRSLDDTKASHALSVVERNARLQARLVEDLLDVSHIAAGRLAVEFVAVDLAPITSAVVDALLPSAVEKGVQVNLVLDDGPAVVRGDGRRLEQVVWNLLTNAIKFTPGEGRVSVRLGRADRLVELVVTDTGEGIAPDFLPFVFDRFRQADASYARRHGGLGLGLALVRAFAEAHGGTATAQSPGPGCGSTFAVRLPLHDDGPAVADNLPSTPGGMGG